MKSQTRKDLAMDVEIARNKKLDQDRPNREDRPDEQQPLSNNFVLLSMIVMFCGVCVYTYYVAQHVHRLEQRVEGMSDHCCSTRQVTSTPKSRSITDRRQRTNAAASVAMSTTSFASTSSHVINDQLAEDWKELSNDVDEGLHTEVGSGLTEVDEDSEFSGDSTLYMYDSYNRHTIDIQSSYDQLNLGRYKRSVSEHSSSNNRRHQQDHQNGRRRRIHRVTSSQVTTSHTSGDEDQQQRRHDRRRPERRRHRIQADSLHNDAVDHRQITGLKAAHFYAPRGLNKHHVSGSIPPATFSFWRADNWTLSQNGWFSLDDDGILTVLQTGLYMIYAQIVYHDLSGRWSFGIYVGDKERVKCINTEQMDAGRHQPGSSSHGVYQHCYTSSVLHLYQLNTVSIRCLYGSRSVVMQPEFTFWGLIQLNSETH